MNRYIEAINEIAKSIMLLIDIIFEDDSISNNTKVNKNTLVDSKLRKEIRQKVEGTGDIVINTYFNHYVEYLEWDRPPMYGKRPPLDALRDWAYQRNIPTDNGTLWVISNAIWRDGHKGRPIFATLEREVVEYLDDKKCFENLFEAIITEITDNFK